MTDIKIFEAIKKINEYEAEYWSARELAKVLEYREYRNFEPVIQKAKQSCKNSGQSVIYHFVDVNDMVEIGDTMPEQLPTPDSLNLAKKRLKKINKILITG